MTIIGFRLPRDLESRLNTLAKTTGRPKSYYVREALVEHLDRFERVYLAETRRIRAKTAQRRHEAR